MDVSQWITLSDSNVSGPVFIFNLGFAFIAKWDFSLLAAVSVSWARLEPSSFCLLLSPPSQPQMWIEHIHTPACCWTSGRGVDVTWRTESASSPGEDPRCSAVQPRSRRGSCRPGLGAPSRSTAWWRAALAWKRNCERFMMRRQATGKESSTPGDLLYPQWPYQPQSAGKRSQTLQATVLLPAHLLLYSHRLLFVSLINFLKMKENVASCCFNSGRNSQGRFSLSVWHSLCFVEKGWMLPVFFRSPGVGAGVWALPSAARRSCAGLRSCALPWYMLHRGWG